MKQGPDGLECAACGTLLEPVQDEAGVTITRASMARNRRVMIISILTVGVALAMWGIFSFAPIQFAQGKDIGSEPALAQSEPAVSQVDDPNSTILHELILSGSDEVVEMALDKGCQRLPGDQASEVQWLNLAGEKVRSVRPEFPGNWRPIQACPLPLSGALFAAMLEDGVAISKVEGVDARAWTQVVSVNEPNAETVALMVDGGAALIVVHDSNRALLQLKAYDDDGAEVWKQQVSTGDTIESIHTAKTGLGYFLIAWRESGIGLRFVIVSPTGFLLENTAVEDRGLPLKGVAQNEFGETLLLLGETEINIELIAQTSETVWQRRLDISGLPIGVLSFETSFFVFAASGERILVWGVDQFGRVSSGLDVSISEAVRGGEVGIIGPSEAMLRVDREGAAPIALVFDLDRLETVLRYEVSDSENALPPGDDVIEEGNRAGRLRENASGENSALSASASTSTDVDIEMPVTRGSPAQERAALPPSSDADQMEADPVERSLATRPVEVDEPRVETRAETAEGPANQIAVVAPEPLRDESATPAPEQTTRARCTFSCVSTDDAAVDYVLMQSVDVEQGETLTDVSLRLNDAHVDLCRVSGGKPVSAFTRECNPE
ncbi:MAG: hypothetical protein AAF437_11320 [Pseudomonadota bacterium]